MQNPSPVVQRSSADVDTVQYQMYEVEGLVGARSAEAVAVAVRTVPGVLDVTVDARAGQVLVAGRADQAGVRLAITRAGYRPV